jgi:hypothetical protein
MNLEERSKYLEERSKYLKIPVTLDGKPARILGTAQRPAEIITIEKDYEGRLYHIKRPWEEVIKIVEEKEGRFYGGKKYVTIEEQQNYITGFVIGVLTVIVILALIEIFSR